MTRNYRLLNYFKVLTRTWWPWYANTEIKKNAGKLRMLNIFPPWVTVECLWCGFAFRNLNMIILHIMQNVNISLHISPINMSTRFHKSDIRILFFTCACVFSQLKMSKMSCKCVFGSIKYYYRTWTSWSSELLEVNSHGLRSGDCVDKTLIRPWIQTFTTFLSWSHFPPPFTFTCSLPGTLG